MKIWKWILGVLALLGGAAAVASAKDKKKYKKDVKENQDKIKKVQVKVKQVEAKKAKTKDAINQQKKKVVKAKSQVKDTGNAKKVAQDFEKKYRHKPGRPKKQP